jgi:hypothetical protein
VRLLSKRSTFCVRWCGPVNVSFVEPLVYHCSCGRQGGSAGVSSFDCSTKCRLDKFFFFLLIFFSVLSFFSGMRSTYRRFTLGLLCGPHLVYHRPNLFLKFLLLEDLPVLVIFFALSMKCELSTFDIKDKKKRYLHDPVIPYEQQK